MKKVLLLLIWVVFLTSCGCSQPTTAIKVNMMDFVYNPNRFVVPSGREITLDQNASTSFAAPSEEGEYLIACSTEGH